MKRDKRNKVYEQKFHSYLFNGDVERFKAICEDLSIISNLKVLQKEKVV